MNEEEKKAIETVEQWLNEISLTNDNNIKQTDNLNMVLINLQIEDARIEQNTGIVPIVEEIERVIHSIHDKTDVLVKTGRTELRTAWDVIKESLLKEE